MFDVEEYEIENSAIKSITCIMRDKLKNVLTRRREYGTYLATVSHISVINYVFDQGRNFYCTNSVGEDFSSPTYQSQHSEMN